MMVRDTSRRREEKESKVICAAKLDTKFVDCSWILGLRNKQ